MTLLAKDMSYYALVNVMPQGEGDGDSNTEHWLCQNPYHVSWFRIPTMCHGSESPPWVMVQNPHHGSWFRIPPWVRIPTMGHVSESPLWVMVQNPHYGSRFRIPTMGHVSDFSAFLRPTFVTKFNVRIPQGQKGHTRIPWGGVMFFIRIP